MGEDKLELNYLDHEKEIEELIKSDDSIIHLISSGRYFELPLKRARQFERWRKVTRTGLGKVLMQEFDTLKDDFDLTQTSSKHHSLISRTLRQNATTMYNQYNMSPEDRDYLIREEGIYNFEVDLDLLALDVAFQSIREDYYENIL
jgi:hypothetical protein